MHRRVASIWEPAGAGLKIQLRAPAYTKKKKILNAFLFGRSKNVLWQIKKANVFMLNKRFTLIFLSFQVLILIGSGSE